MGRLNIFFLPFARTQLTTYPKQPPISLPLAHAQRSMLITLVQGLALLLACSAVLIQCIRLRAAKKRDDEPALEPTPIPPTFSKPQVRPEPGSRICRHSTLSNGIRVATEAFRVENGDRARINVIVGVGSRHETEEINGVAHFTEHMILRGPTEATHLKSIELAHFDNRLNGATFTERTEFNLNCPEPADVEQSIALLATMLVSPDFQDVNVDRERPIIEFQCQQTFMNPLALSINCMHKVAFHPNPIGLFSCGQQYTNAAITASDIRRFYGAHYKSNNTIITVVGEVDHDEIVRLAEHHFKDYPKGDAVEAPLATWKHDYRVCLTPQTNRFFGEIAVKGPSGYDFVASEEGLIIQLFNYTFLSNTLAMPPGFHRNVHETMSLLPYKEFSSVSQCFFSNQGLIDSIIRWRMLAYFMTEAKLEATKDYYKARKLGHLQDLEHTSLMLNMHMFHAGRPYPPDELWSRVQAITLDRFKSVAKRILLDGEFTLVGYGFYCKRIMLTEVINLYRCGPWPMTEEWLDDIKRKHRKEIKINK